MRDSLDEQIIADIIACILNEEPIQRSRQALDKIYKNGSRESIKFEKLLSSYGEDDIKRDFLTVFDRVQILCDKIEDGNLQTVLSKNKHNNEVSTIFSALFLAFYNLIIVKKMDIADYGSIISSVKDLTLTTQRKAIEPNIRKANINSIKGCIEHSFYEDDVRDIPLGKPLIYTFENSLRRSRIELPHYEFKQGFLNLSNSRAENRNVIQGILQTICGMANIAPHRDSYIYIGICDKQDDCNRIEQIDKISAVIFEGRFVVGVEREAKILGMSLDSYVMRVKDKISSSELSGHLKGDVLSRLDCFVYKNLDVIRIVVPGQNQVSFLGDECYTREGSSTVKAPVQTIPEIARRFAS